MMTEFCYPTPPTPKHLNFLMTTRHGGVSQGAYASMNLAYHVGDVDEAVTQNRKLLLDRIQAQSPNIKRIAFMQQVHGIDCVDLDNWDGETALTADAALTTRNDLALCVMVADCLPIVFYHPEMEAIAITHSGWRGLAFGVLQQTQLAINQKGLPPLQHWHTWVGVGISQAAFEVGAEVRSAFCDRYENLEKYFEPSARAQHFYADLSACACSILESIGVTQIKRAFDCSYTNQQQFYSYRRDKTCGRMATCIWINSEL